MENNLNFHPATPILRVHDLSSSLAYYVHKLGFSIDWEDEAVFAAVSRGDAHLMLCQGDQGQGKAWVYIGVGDAAQLHQEYELRGAVIRQAPTNFRWALEIQAEDLDGNVIRFGSEPREDMPFGPWLDMHGTSWELPAGLDAPENT